MLMHFRFRFLKNDSQNTTFSAVMIILKQTFYMCFIDGTVHTEVIP